MTLTILVMYLGLLTVLIYAVDRICKLISGVHSELTDIGRKLRNIENVIEKLPTLGE